MKPEQLGLTISNRRRTPGLRREEVAQLAGVGITWYTWLEQGRAINVSSELLDSLARVFLLTEEERSHLFTLANKPIINQIEEYRPINDSLIHILEKLDHSFCPAYIMDHYWNLVAWNKCASLVFGDFEKLTSMEKNIVYLMFCKQDYMELFDHWEFHAKGIIARFRGTMAKHIDDPCYIEFVNDLKSKNEYFSKWWSLHDVNGMSDVLKELTHKLLGKVKFEFTSFDVSDNQNFRLLIYNPDDVTLKVMKNYLCKENDIK